MSVLLKAFLLLMISCSYAEAVGYLEIVKKHCYECHGPEDPDAALDLTIFEDIDSFYVHFDTLRNIYDAVKYDDMPPEKKSKMTVEERKTLADLLGAVIQKIETTASNKTGSTVVRRLTNYEYDNSVKAVTGLDLNLSKNFPVDSGGGEGFGNDSAILGVSALHFERYLEAAEKISTFSRFDIEHGIVFQKKAYFPKTRPELIHSIDKDILSLFSSHYPKNFSIPRYLPKLMEAVNEFNLARKNMKKLNEIATKFDLNETFLKKGIRYFSTSAGKGMIEKVAIKTWLSLRQQKYNSRKASEYARKFTKEYDAVVSQLNQVPANKKKDYLYFINNIKNLFTFSDEELLKRVDKDNFEKYDQLKILQDLMQNDLSFEKIEKAEATFKSHIRRFLTKVHRKPPSNRDLRKMTKGFMETIEKYGVDTATQILVARAFAHMKFIYRHEDKADKPTRISDYELANRLSYFLWGTPPDQELMDLASKNELNDPKVLERQVNRMLCDSQSINLSKYFAAQWLHFGEVLDIQGPDRKKFPEFSDELARDMWQESVLFFDYIVRNDRSVLDVIDADYTFVNNSLREIYDLNKGPNKFNKVTLKNKIRGGITGHASVLTLTSGGLRTSPIFRGNWVLSSLLGTPTPPAPANVDPLPEEEVVSENLTLKKQLAFHRDLPQCKSCHMKIDPLGFPLENFDPMGRWRDKYENAPIDAVGETADGKRIDGPLGLKRYLLRNKDVFLKNMSRKLFSYALGRSMEYYDFYVINEMTRELKDNDYKFSSMVRKIVSSYQFQHKN